MEEEGRSPDVVVAKNQAANGMNKGRNISQAYRKFLIWRMRHVSERSTLLMLSVVVGLAVGFVAVLLKNAVHFVNRSLLQYSVPTYLGGNLLVLVYPALGILLTILFTKYVIRGNIGHGLPSVLLAISRKKGYLPPKNMWASFVASTVTVAFGGSVGLEAPIASTGSAIGSNMARLFHLKPQSVKMLLGCGAAASIAGIFKAPVAGVLFVVEVFMFDLTMTSVMPLLISALCGFLVAYFFMGSQVVFAFKVAEPFDLVQLPFYIILGVFCAAVSVYFLRVTDRVEGLLQKLAGPYRRFAVGAVVLGVLIFLFPPLFGEGYGYLTNLLNGSADSLFDHSIFGMMADNEWTVLGYLLMLIVLKAVATATTIGSGGVGGTFGPSLIIGGFSGYFVALLLNQMGLPTQSATNFALVGMAAVMSGVMHAPFMATFLIAEITGGYGLLTPLMFTVVVTYLCVSPFERHSIYARKLAAKGDLMTHDKDSSAWQLIDLRRLIETNFATVRGGDKLRDLVEAVKRSSRNLYPVLDRDDHLLGVIALDDVKEHIFRPELYDEVRVEELMHELGESEVVRITDTPAQLVDKFKVGDLYNVIVVDEQGRYMGYMSRANMFSAYRKFVFSVSEE